MRTIFGPAPIPNTAWAAAVRLDVTNLLVGAQLRQVDQGYVLDLRPAPGVVVQVTRPLGRIQLPMPRMPQPYDLPKMDEQPVQ